MLIGIILMFGVAMLSVVMAKVGLWSLPIVIGAGLGAFVYVSLGDK